MFYRHAKTAGFVYQAVLRSELTARLGVEWGAVRNGVAELSIVAPAVRDMFSTRRKEIEAEMDARGASSARAAQVAAVRTRTTKTFAAGTDVLRATWRQQVADANIDLDMFDTITPTTPTNTPEIDSDPDTHVTVDTRSGVGVGGRRRVVEELMGETGLTGSRVSFGRGDVVRAWCERIDTATLGVNADLVDELVDHTVGDRRAVTLGDGDVLSGVADRRRWSTAGLLALENRIVTDAAAGRDRGVGVVPSHLVDDTIRRRESLSVEQADMVRAVTGNGHRIDAVVGVAGSGKTFALGAAHDAWTRAGYRVIGVAAVGKAARGLPRFDDVAHLTENRRQHHRGERDALREVRAGNVRAGLDWYVRSGRVTPTTDMDHARAAIVEAWWNDRTRGNVD